MSSSSSTINNSMHRSQDALNLEAAFGSYINSDYVLPERRKHRIPSPPSKLASQYSGIRMEDLEIDGSISLLPSHCLQSNSKKASSWQNSLANIDPAGVNAQYNQLWCIKWLNNAVDPNVECKPLPENTVWCCSTPWANRCGLTDELHLLPVLPPVEENPNTNILGLGFVPPPYDTVNPMDIFSVPRNA